MLDEEIEYSHERSSGTGRGEPRSTSKGEVLGLRSFRGEDCFPWELNRVLTESEAAPRGLKPSIKRMHLPQR